MFEYKINDDETGKLAGSSKLAHALLIAGLVSTVLTLAASNAANASTRYCYQHPGLGRVCVVVN